MNEISVLEFLEVVWCKWPLADGEPNRSFKAVVWACTPALSYQKMSHETALSTPKSKKRVPQLVAFYNEIGTPRSEKKRSEPDMPSQDIEPTPTKKKKLKEVPVEPEVVPMEVVETPVVVETVEEETKSKESKSARKSRRVKEAAFAKYTKRIFCANEMLSTERTYVDALQNLHKVRSLLKSRVPFRYHFRSESIGVFNVRTVI